MLYSKSSQNTKSKYICAFILQIFISFLTKLWKKLGSVCLILAGWIDFFFRPLGWNYYASLANISINIIKKTAFMKNNWIWVYKMWARRKGGEFFMHSRGVDIFGMRGGGGLFFLSHRPIFLTPSAIIKQPLPYELIVVLG